jgi:hypothetical protein
VVDDAIDDQVPEPPHLFRTHAEGVDLPWSIHRVGTLSAVRRTTIALLLATFAAVLGGTWLAWHREAWHRSFRDTQWYVRQGYVDAGRSRQQATALAISYRCHADPVCRADAVTVFERPARYEAIFSSRPGYPALLTAAIRLKGDRGVDLVTFAIALAATGTAALLAFLVGGLSAAPLGALAFALSPAGYWASRALSDGLARAFVLAALAGALLVLRGRRTLGLVVMLGSVAALVPVRDSDAVALAGALAVAGLLVHRGRVLVVAGLAGAAVAFGVVRLLGWPGLMESLQDSYSDHFQRPDVPDAWSRLLRGQWDLFTTLAVRPLLVAELAAIVLASLWAVRRRPEVAWPAVLVGLTGPASLVAHPAASEVSRMLTSLVAPAVVALALAVELLVSQAWNGRRSS